MSHHPYYFLIGPCVVFETGPILYFWLWPHISFVALALKIRSSILQHPGAIPPDSEKNKTTKGYIPGRRSHRKLRGRSQGLVGKTWEELGGV